MTPDERRYALAATGQRIARPFHYRWLLPRLCGRDARRWHWSTHGALYGLLPATYWYVGGTPGLAAAASVVGLAGIWAFNREHPILVDAPALLCALVAAGAIRHGLWPLAIPLSILGGCIRETSPAFAALYAWNPLPLVGMVAPAIRHLQHAGPDVLDDENRWILEHPVAASRKYHRELPRWAWVAPWGAGLLALGAPSAQLYATLAVAYVQCAFATDTVRLYQWAFPVVLAAAVGVVPAGWLVLFVVAHWANPFATGGT